MVAGGMTGAQIRALRELVSVKTDSDELSMLMREDLDLRLDALTSVNKKFDILVFELIETLERNGNLSRFIEAFSSRKPYLSADLEAILSGSSARQLRSIDREQIKQLRLEFRERRENFGYLKAYKKLHDVLHAISGVVPQLKKEAEDRAKINVPIPEDTVDNLEQWRDDAVAWSSKTEHPNLPPISDWVPRFEAAVHSFLGEDSVRHAKALASIARVPGQQLSSLNNQLVYCAANLKVEELVNHLDEMPIIELGLAPAVARFRDPCMRLGAMIEDHHACQRIDVELQLAGGLAVYSPEEIEDWANVKECLAKLAGRRSSKEVSRTQLAADVFEKTPSASSFGSFFEKFSKMFKKIDEELLVITTELLDDATNLSDALEGLK
jgi:hypothetical protein